MDTQADPIEKLPVTQGVQPNVDEIQVMNRLFAGESKGILKTIVNEMKEGVLVALLFVLLSLPQTDAVIKKIVPSTVTSTVILILLKVVVLVLLYWFIKNYWLCRK